MPLHLKASEESKNSKKFRIIGQDGLEKRTLDLDYIKRELGDCSILLNDLEKGKINTRVSVEVKGTVDTEGYGTKVKCPKCVKDLVLVLTDIVFKLDPDMRNSSLLSRLGLSICVFSSKSELEDSLGADMFIVKVSMCEASSPRESQINFYNPHKHQIIFIEQPDGTFVFKGDCSDLKYKDALPKELEQAIFDFVDWCVKVSSPLKLHSILYQAFGDDYDDSEGTPVTKVVERPLYEGFCSIRNGFYEEIDFDEEKVPEDEFALCLVQHIHA